MTRKEWKKHFEGMRLHIIKKEIKELEEYLANVDDVCWSCENDDDDTDYCEEKLRMYKKEAGRRIQRINEINNLIKTT